MRPAGYALGANWQHVANDFHGPTYAIAGIVVVALAVAVVLHFRRSRAAGDVGEPAGTDSLSGTEEQPGTEPPLSGPETDTQVPSGRHR